jgi:hypothetical protein
VKEFDGWLQLLLELLHLPGEPAGVGAKWAGSLAAELFHLPDKPAGVLALARSAPSKSASQALAGASG